MVNKMEKIIIVGYGGHAKSMADSIKAAGQYEIAGYTDVENKHEKDIEYLGTDDVLPDLYNDGIRNAALGLGYMGKSMVRDRIYENLCGIGFSLPVIIDPSAVIALDAIIREGTFVGKKAVVNAGASIGKMCIINTGAIIEHGNEVQDFTHIAVGAVLCGDILVGSHCLIGANATVLQGLRIGNNTIIGGGSMVLRNVEDSVTYFEKREQTVCKTEIGRPQDIVLSEFGGGIVETNFWYLIYRFPIRWISIERGVI